MASTEKSSENTQCTEAETPKSSLQTMDEEINALTTEFKGQCKVLETGDRFVKTVKLHPENLDVVFNFKLTASYPSSLPVIEIRSASIDEDDLFDLHGFLTQWAESATSRTMDSIVQVALEWLAEGRISLKGNTKHKKSKTQDRNEKREKRNQLKKSKLKEAKDDVKKPPMKTATDVIKRIQWDKQLDTDQVLVGYMDRIDGLKEKYFNAFSWEDISSVDYTVLAIPKHRIQYFKYRGEVVWDKRSRLDNVFGSTGSNKTIKDVITQQEKHAGQDTKLENNEDEGIHPGDEHVESDYEGYDDDSESDSDDDINVIVDGATGGVSDGDYGDEDDDMCISRTTHNDDDNDDHFDKYWRDKLRPNYFIALRVTDEELRNSVQEVQDYIAANDPQLKQCHIPNGALHLTLCTVGLETPEQVANAVKCLADAQSELEGMVPKDKKLKFKGVENFFNRVVYGKVIDCPPQFYELVEHLKLCLNERGIDIRDYHEFVPHMTLMKISRPVSRAIGKKYIPPWLYSCFNDTELGSQAVDNLHLCEMGDDRQPDGFYITAHSMSL